MARRFGSAIISNTDSTVAHYIPIKAYTCQGIYRYKKTTKAKTEKTSRKDAKAKVRTMRQALSRRSGIWA